MAVLVVSTDEKVRKFLSAAFGIFQLILLVLYLMPQRYILPVLVASLTVSLVDAILLCTLSYLEHERSLHPSSLMVIYLFISALLDAARLRTLWLLPIGRLSFSLASSIALATKVAMLVSESAGKARYFLHPDDKERSPEETSGILSNGLFVWANHLLFVGFRKLLLLSDLYRLPNSLSVTATQSKFGVAWDSTTPSSYRLAWAILKAFYPRLLLPVTPRLFLLAFTLLQPILMQNLLNWLSNHNERESIGYGLLGAYVAVYVGLAVFTGLYWRLHLQLITMIRGTLISSIYRKVLTINMDDAQKATLTLMSNDVEMSCHGLQHIHELYANILQIGIATWLLQRQIGASCAIPAVVAAICAVATYKISQHVGHCQKEWLETVQTRLSEFTRHLYSLILPSSGYNALQCTPRW